MPRAADPAVRLALVETAAELLARREPVTARSLADRVGTSTTALYTHFGGMPGLWRAVRNEGFVRLGRRLAAVPRTDDPVRDLAAQVEQAYLNVATALAAVGGGFDDVAKLTLYVVDWSPEKLAALGAGVGRAAEALRLDLTKPVTLLPVAALGEPDLLVEVDAIAVLP